MNNEVKIKIDRYPYAGNLEGYAIYFKGNKVNLGVFPSLRGLRDYWNKYRVLICAGYYCHGPENWIKGNVPLPQR